MTDTKIVYVMARRICWPDPDATCLEGGCIHCDDHPLRPLGEIAKWARGKGQVPNRYGAKTQDASQAWAYGLEHHFFNVDSRTVPRRVPASKGNP